MLFINQNPFVRLIVPFAAGIVVAMAVGWDPGPVWFIVTVAMVLAAFAILKQLISFRWRWLSGVFMFFILFIAGYGLLTLYTPGSCPGHIATLENQKGIVIFRVDEPVSEKERSIRVIAVTDGIMPDSTLQLTNGRVLLYLEKDSMAASLRYGDRFIADVSLRTIDPPYNPGQFNYRRYLADRGILLQAYVSGERWKYIGKGHGNLLRRWSARVRTHLREILVSQQLPEKQLAIASAMLLGYDDLLDPELRQDFAGAGAMHILCISGLHVGIISMVAAGMLSFLNRRKSWRKIRIILLLLIIWSYALISGLSPSVQRAATMFSFIMAGQSLERKISIYNSLAAAAFVLLVFDPYLIRAVGFQLSFLAVTGIVILYPLIYRSWIPRHRLTDKIWSLTVVSVSATVATFPLSIYYFHQFPLLFPITNLVAIPASALIIYSGMILFATHFIPVIGSLAGAFLWLVTRVLQLSVAFIEDLSFSTIQDLYYDEFQVVLIFMLLSGLTALIHSFHVRKLIFALFAACLLTGYTSSKRIDNLMRRELWVYNLRGSTAIGFIESKRAILLCDSALMADKGKAEFYLRNHFGMCGTDEPEYLDIRTPRSSFPNMIREGNYIRFGDLRILLLTDTFRWSDGLRYPNADLVLVSGNPKINISEIKERINPEKLVFDSSNAPWALNKWIKACDSLQVGYYCTEKQYAFSVTD